MTSIHGTGKNWGGIQQKLVNVNLSAAQPAEIEPLLERCQAEYEQQIKQVRQKLKTEISQLRQEVLQEEEKTRANLAAAAENNSMAIQQSEAVLDVIKQDRGIFHLVRNYFRSKHEAEKIASLRTDLQTQHIEIEQPLHAKEMELDRKKAQIDELARQECQEILGKIEMLRAILSSSELAGANAENDLLEALSGLPDNTHVLNNVTIKMDKGVLFEGVAMINAQIDTLVLTPSGLFAIALKNWSKQANDKETSDPYDQIKRAAQLCHEMIKAELPGVTVRSILAYRGRPPETQNPGIVKALPVPEVASYINWFKDNTLSERTLQFLLTRLSNTGTANPSE